MLTRARFVLALASLAPLAACGPVPGETPAPTSCPALEDVTPIVHPRTLTQSERWTATAPHRVEGDTSLAPGVTLTIDPCARVVFARDASLTVSRNGANLIAEGTATQPITFAGDRGARWGQVTIEQPARASLRYVNLSDGGADRFHGHATIMLRGDALTPAKPVARLDHVTVTGSLGPGVRVDRAATFAMGSTDLRVSRSGGDVVPFPVVIGEHAIDALPTGVYTGNRTDEILIAPEGANARGGLQEDATLHDRGVPYRIGDSAVDRFAIGAGGSDAPRRTTLTIEPGVVMRFHPATVLEVEHYTGEFAASGVLRAVGTADRPIVMTSASATPRAGDWRGVWYGGVPSADNRLEHVRLEYTGHDCGCILHTCSDVQGHEAAVIFSAAPPSAFIRDVTFAHGSSHGVFRGWRGAASPDFAAGNTFEDMAGCAQTLPSLPDGCGGRPACR